MGTVPLVSGEIAEDITSYFAESEQIPTACALGVLVDVDQSVQCAGGYLIQLLPGADDAAISAIEQGIARVGPVTEALRGGLSARELVEQVLSEFQLEVLSEEPVEYRCYCSPGAGHPRPHQHGAGGVELPHPGAGQGRAHLPVLRQGISLYKRGAGRTSGLTVGLREKKQKILAEMVDNWGKL